MDQNNPIKVLWNLLRDVYGPENVDEDSFGKALLYLDQEIETNDDLEWKK